MIQTSRTSQPECLLPPPDRVYVRSFLFSRRISAPLARVHLIARVILVFSLSSALLKTINTAHPDPLGAGILWLVGLALFVSSGVSYRVARLYFFLTLPALSALFITWTVFNPVRSGITLLRLSVYAGSIQIGLAPWQGILIAVIGGYFLLTRKLFFGVMVGILLAFIQTHWFPLPEWSFTQVAIFHPLTLLVSTGGLLVAITKVIGYSGMVLATIALVISTRDVELIGAFRQLHLPQVVIFFLSTVFRSLDLALADYTTIRQAQIARAIQARPRSFIRRLRDLASIAVPMVALMIRRSSEIGDALLARGYTLGRPSRNFYETSPWRLVDWLVLAASVGLVYQAIGLQLNATTLLLH